MSETVYSMKKLETSSRRLEDVLALIDDIALQVGMLSLNAGVEAARAGELGPGLSGVASEVRQLAQRCSESAAEIRQLMGDALDPGIPSSSHLQQVSGAVDSVVDSVHAVSGCVHHISKASAMQRSRSGKTA